MPQGIIAIGVLFLVVIFFTLIFVYASRVKKVGPNEVLVISGRGEGRRDIGEIESRFRIVTGGRAFCSHLAALGLIPGVEFEVKRNAPGGPFILGLKGGQLVIGRGMAQKILVS